MGSAEARALHLAYDVLPTRAAWSERDGGRGVTQTIECDFDSLVACELFAGAVAGRAPLGLEVTDAVSGLVVARSAAVEPPVSPGWVRFDEWSQSGGFVRGQPYRFAFRRSGGDEIEYYWDATNPYAPGGLVGAGSLETPARDLACRIFAENRTIDRKAWGTHARSFLYFDTTWHGGTDSGRATRLLRAAADAGLSWDRNYVGMQSLFPRPGELRIGHGDAPMDRAVLESARRGIRVLPCIHGSAFWATSANTSESVPSNRFWTWPGFTRWHSRLPRGLEHAVDGAGEEANPFAEFAAAYFRRYGPGDREGFYARNGLDAGGVGCRYVEIWNEPNVYVIRDPSKACGYLLFPDPGVDRHLDSIFPADGRHAAGRWGREEQWRRCSLYVRLCQVADSARRIADPQVRLLAGGVAGVRAYSVPTPHGYGDDVLVRGDTWLQWFFQLGGHRFVDGIAVHPFQLGWGREGYRETAMQADMEFLDSLLGAYDARDLELWVTEIPFFSAREPGASGMRQAASLLAFAVAGVTGLGSSTKPYDRIIQYALVDDSSASGWEPAGLLTPGLAPKPAYWLLHHATRALGGRAFVRRLPQEALDDSLFGIYEFADSRSRFWLCWRNGRWGSTERLRIPARTDNLIVIRLATETGDTAVVPVGPDGWYRSESWDSVPLFVAESGHVRRPDLNVERVWFEPEEQVVGMPTSVHARVRNIGNRATPRGYETTVEFRVEGELLGSVGRAVSIAAGEAVDFELTLDPASRSRSGPGFWVVTVNPGQRYVELSADNNSGYVAASSRGTTR